MNTQEISKSLDITIDQLVRDVYAETSPFANATLAAFALVNEANGLDTSEMTIEALEVVIKLRKAYVELDGHNWCDFDRAVNKGVIDTAQFLVARKSGLAVR